MLTIEKVLLREIYKAPWLWHWQENVISFYELKELLTLPPKLKSDFFIFWLIFLLYKK